jgi:hypothetical protein
VRRDVPVRRDDAQMTRPLLGPIAASAISAMSSGAPRTASQRRVASLLRTRARAVLRRVTENLDLAATRPGRARDVTQPRHRRLGDANRRAPDRLSECGRLSVRLSPDAVAPRRRRPSLSLSLSPSLSPALTDTPTRHHRVRRTVTLAHIAHRSQHQRQRSPLAESPSARAPSITKTPGIEYVSERQAQSTRQPMA